MTVENLKHFNDRLKFFWATQVTRIRVCYMLAKYSHRHDTRKEIGPNGPIRYFEHARRVALIVLDEVGVKRDHERASDLICAALLHDCLEDSHTVDKVILESVAGKCVASSVVALSKQYVVDHMLDSSQVVVPHSEYATNLLRSEDWVVPLVKLCDRVDNMRHLDDCSHAFRKRQAEETSITYLDGFRSMLSKLPNEYKVPATSLVAELERLCEGYA